MKKGKLFSGKSLLISVKGIVSSILTMITSIPLWGLGYFLMRKGYIVVGSIFSLLTLVWYLFFWGWVSNKLWKWN